MKTSKTDHARCENAQKQYISVARRLEGCIHGQQGVFHEFLQRSILFLSQCFEMPAMQVEIPAIQEHAGGRFWPPHLWFIRPLMQGLSLKNFFSYLNILWDGRIFYTLHGAHHSCGTHELMEFTAKGGLTLVLCNVHIYIYIYIYIYRGLRLLCF